MLTVLFSGKNTQHKVASIGQAIVQSVRPRSVIPPLQIGLGVQLFHLHRSKFLLQTLHSMAFCSSYDEIERFQANAANCCTFDLFDSMDMSIPTVLFTGDNVDHNIRTLDGKGTFHGMGIIACITPGQMTSHSAKAAYFELKYCREEQD
jgi:hypothetical protein